VNCGRRRGSAREIGFGPWRFFKQDWPDRFYSSKRL
jgi:hypothetical protein